MNRIWLVVGMTKYEGSSSLKGFLKKKKAEAFAAECLAYSQREPKYPNLADPDQKSKMATWRQWRSENPAGDDEISYDGYIAYEIEVEE